MSIERENPFDAAKSSFDEVYRRMKEDHDAFIKNNIRAEGQQDASLQQMRDVWCWALSWFMKVQAQPPSPDKNKRQAALVQAIKENLSMVETIPELHHLHSRDSIWCLQTARAMYPREWPTLGVHATAAAAYGLRHVEIMTDRKIDAREPLPKWVSEWAIW